MSKGLEHTISKGDKWGWLTVIYPRIKVPRGVPYHRCVCACGNPEFFDVQQNKLIAGDRVTCNKCHLHRMPVTQYGLNDYPTLRKHVARIGPSFIINPIGEIMWKRDGASVLPFPYRICLGDQVLVAGTSYVGIVCELQQNGRILVQFEEQAIEYKTEQLLLLGRPGL